MKLFKKKVIFLPHVEFCRGYIKCSDERRDSEMATLGIQCCKFMLDKTENKNEFGYVYDNWSFHELRDLADSIYAFLKEKSNDC